MPLELIFQPAVALRPPKATLPDESTHNARSMVVVLLLRLASTPPVLDEVWNHMAKVFVPVLRFQVLVVAVPLGEPSLVLPGDWK